MESLWSEKILRQLEWLEISAERGFLPLKDPLPYLSLPHTYFANLELLAHKLPKYLAARAFRKEAQKLGSFRGNIIECLSTEPLRRRAMMIYSYFGHAWVWEDPETPMDFIPYQIALPWFNLSKKLSRHPILSYASYALDNWRRIDPEGPIELDNIILLQDFLGGMDEEWFILVHVDIEAKAGPALAGILEAYEAMFNNDPVAVNNALSHIYGSLLKIYATLRRMPERCNPYIYYHRVRPYIHGWVNNPALPNGVLYQDVEEYKNKPQKFHGETGAQSSIIPALDAALGIKHEADSLTQYLWNMRQYMPPRHRTFIEFVEAMAKVKSLSDFVLEIREHHPEVWDVYTKSIHMLHQIRDLHLQYAKSYIAHQAEVAKGNPTDVGTGGTPFIQDLTRRRDESIPPRS